MSIKIIKVETKKDLERFIFLPEKLYRNYDNWLPPMYRDERKYYNPSKNKVLTETQTQLALAYKDGRPAGRIMGIIYPSYNEEIGRKEVRFNKFDCINDPGVAEALLNFIAEWGRSHGMDQMIGPYGFTGREPQGALIEGFDIEPVISTPSNPPYIPLLIENAGFKPDTRWVEYQFPVPAIMPPIYERVYKRMINQGRFQIIDFRKKEEVKPYVIPVLQLINDAFRNHYGFVPMSEEEMKKLASNYWPVMDPRFIKVVTEGDRIVGAVIAIPHISEGIKKARGRLFPFGYFHLRSALKQTRQLDLMLGGIREDVRGKGIDVLISVHMIRSAREAGMQIIDSHLELEENRKIRSEMERLGGKIVKRFATFRKTIK